MENDRPAWSVPTKIMVILISFVALGFLLYKFSVAIIPLILAAILAYILTPLVTSIQRRLKIKRGLVILLVYLVLILLIATIFMLVTPMLGHQIRRLDLDVQELIDQARALIGQQFMIAGVVIDGQLLLQDLSESFQAGFDPIFTQMFDLVKVILSSLIWIVFIFMVSIYLIKDSAALEAWFENLPPPDYRQDFIRLRELIKTIWSSFFRSQLLLSLVVMAIITTEALILGLRFALVLGILAGLLEFLPSIGHGIWLITACLVALIGGSRWIPVPNWTFMLIVICVHAVFTQLDLNYLIPRIIGRSVHLPPLVVILGIVAGASFAGVLGVVLAAPTIASLRILSRYVYARLVDIDPFPEEMAPELLPRPQFRLWHRRTPHVEVPTERREHTQV
jgi:predicted PurR-regulated permease PerM